jgi:hypothetical protein
MVMYNRVGMNIVLGYFQCKFLRHDYLGWRFAGIN